MITIYHLLLDHYPIYHLLLDHYPIYHQRHAELKAQYLGQYIAMHEGQVVDHDADFPTLRQRIRQQFENTPVMITLVEEDAEQTLVRHGFRN